MMGIKKLLEKVIQTIPTKEMNWAYDFFTRVYKKRAQGSIFEAVMPRILPTQAEIEVKAAKKLAQVLMVIKLDSLVKEDPRAYIRSTFLVSAAERHKYREELTSRILTMLHSGELARNGSSIFLQEEDIPSLAQLIAVDREFFHKKAEVLKILRCIMDDPTKLSYLRNELVEYGNDQYTLQHYRVITRDGMVNNLTMLIDDTQVVAGDNRPSVVLVPGIACNSRAFDLNRRYSLAAELAHRGYWVYLFEPRGMGRNKGSFDVDCTLDTLIDYDLPAVIEFVYRRSKGKPVVLVGHSMGAVVSEFMLQLWGRQKDEESLSRVKGLITLGMPGNFDRSCHIIYPLLLWLNYTLPILQVDRVPLDDVLPPLTKTPILKWLFSAMLRMDIADLNFLINPQNFSDPNFMFDFIRYGVEGFPLGIGFQFQKAIYNGRGITRMDDRFGKNGEKYNYTDNIGLFPSIPSIHFLGERDPLAPPKTNNFAGCYRHTVKKTFWLGERDDYDIPPTPSQVTYFVVPRTKHIDLLYGKTATALTHPWLFKAIDSLWAIPSK